MISKQHFGNMPDGQAVESYRLTNDQGMSVDILTLGGIIQRWIMPAGNALDIVLGFDTLEQYLADECYMGTAVGRYANRIANGKFSLNGTTYELSTNLLGNTLHGGKVGFSSKVWEADITSAEANPAIRLSLVSENGDQGFPGCMTATVSYCLTEDNTLRITYTATSDQDTLFNPTQHSYFNLSGHDSGTVKDHLLQVNASYYTPADEKSIPFGNLCSVADTVFDLRQISQVGNVLEQPSEELTLTQGLDHNLCIDGYKHNQQQLNMAALLVEPQSGRRLKVYTTMPGIQIYTGNFIGAGLPGKNGCAYAPHHGICLETQFYPDAPNKADFPSPTLKKGEIFESVTEYRVE